VLINWLIISCWASLFAYIKICSCYNLLHASSASLPSTSSSRTSPELYQTASFKRFYVSALSDTSSVFTLFINSNQVDLDSLFKLITENVKECKYYDATQCPHQLLVMPVFTSFTSIYAHFKKNHNDLINFLSLQKNQAKKFIKSSWFFWSEHILM